VLVVGIDAGLKDLTTYFWRVIAVDRYGKKQTSSQTWHFRTNNTNELPAIIKGYVTDVGTGSALAGATVTSSTAGSITTAANGAYILTVPAGSLTVSAGATGYLASIADSLFATSGGVYTKNIALKSEHGNQTVTIVVSGPGGTASPAGPQTVAYGGSISFTLTPDNGYHIGTVNSTCGGLLNGSTFGIGTVTADCTITVTFSSTVQSSGDVTGDGTVDVSDALRILRIAAGLITPNATDLANGDVAPLVNGVPVPDGKIDIGDAVVILRRAVGILTW